MDRKGPHQPLSPNPADDFAGGLDFDTFNECAALGVGLVAIFAGANTQIFLLLLAHHAALVLLCGFRHCGNDCQSDGSAD